MKRVNPWKFVLDVTASLLMIAAAFTLIWVNVFRPSLGKPSQPRLVLPTDPVSIAGFQQKGSPDAKVVLITFSDYQCSYCGRVARDTLPRIDRDYVAPGRVRLAFAHFPLTAIHPLAMGAAESAECAGRQNRFWEMHDLLFKDGASLDRAGLSNAAQNLGLDMVRFGACIDSEASSIVRKQTALAASIGLASTPVFLAGVMRSTDDMQVLAGFSGAKPFSEFADMLDRVLKEVNEPRPSLPEK